MHSTAVSTSLTAVMMMTGTWWLSVMACRSLVPEQFGMERSSITAAASCFSRKGSTSLLSSRVAVCLNPALRSMTL